MLIARVYSVLDTTVVEISCVHSGDPTSSHLVIREERRGMQPSLNYALVALADVADTAGSLLRAQRAGLAREGLADCEEGWVSPSG